MGQKLLLSLFCMIIILAGCHKSSNVNPILPPPYGTPKTFAIANVLQSNMVVQRDKPFIIWGQGPTGQTVNVGVSWNPGAFSAVTDASGLWKVTIPAAAANNNPQSITCTTAGTTTVTLTNILIGDVWLCSGQSNMVMQVDAIAPFTGVLDYQTEIAAANYPNIRVLTVKEDYQNNPISNLTNAVSWTTCSPQTAGNFSAAAYFFARKLYTTLNVPIGIVVSAINGSWCESWINKEAFTAYPAIQSYSSGNSGSQLYNGMISPFINMQLKGFIWYQGENNQHNNPVSDYTLLNTALINGWRTVFNQGKLPFYLVQLTPFAEDYDSTTPIGGDPTANWLGFFREAQANVVIATPGTGMAITMDVGEAANHHPRNKKPVGERLALLALKNSYGQNVICDGPKYASYSVSSNTATISFLGNTAKGLNTINNQPLNQYFFVAGADQVFRQGMAQISGNNIVVTAPAATPLPIRAIRYAFTNAPVTNLQNDSGLPMEPFRTDNWLN